MTPILPLLEPLIRTLLDRHLAAAVEWFPHELVPYEVGTHHGDAPWRADDSRATQHRGRERSQHHAVLG